MAKNSHFLLRNVRGKIGELTFRKGADGTTIISRSIEENNTKTAKQQINRMRFGNIAANYALYNGHLQGAFEFKSSNMSDGNAFMRANMTKSPSVYLTKADRSMGGCVLAPYIISCGHLPSIEVTIQEGRMVTSIALGSLNIDENTTVAEFANAIVSNNKDFEYGDQITFYRGYQLTDSTTHSPYAKVVCYKVTLKSNDERKLRDIAGNDGFATLNGFCSSATAITDGGSAWIHSSLQNKQLKVSTQRLVLGNTFYESYTTPQAFEAAAMSYGGFTNNAYLQPEQNGNANIWDGSTLPPQQGGNTEVKYIITVVSANTAMGTASGSGEYETGATVTLSASANAGYAFDKWSDGSTANPRQITVNGNGTYTATFKTSTPTSGGMMGD